MRKTFRCVASHEHWYTPYNCITAASDPGWPVRQDSYSAWGFKMNDHYGYGEGNGFGFLHRGDLDGSAWRGSSSILPSGSSEELMPTSMPMTCEDGRRTERVFRCAGCIGGCECPVHGVRL